MLAQPRVSTHLAKLREAGLVVDRKSGVQSYYRPHPDFSDSASARLWQSLKECVDDALLADDAERLPAVLAARARSRNWADTVAGDMERHYSPGRTWEATTRAMLQLLELGDVLDVASGDGVLAEMLAHRSRSVTCLDSSDRVVKAGATRLKDFDNVRFLQGDMHQLDFSENDFDVVLLMHALTYTPQPGQVISEAFRVLRPGGILVGSTLKAHGHEAAVAPFNHVNQGFKPSDLRRLCRRAGFKVDTCSVTSRETKAPNFEIITLLAHKP